MVGKVPVCTCELCPNGLSVFHFFQHTDVLVKVHVFSSLLGCHLPICLLGCHHTMVSSYVC